MRRSRFKVAASIPVRRKPGVQDEKVEESTQQHDEAKETDKITESATATEVVKDIKEDVNAETKPFFKRIKPPVQLPIKKQRPRPAGGIKQEPPITEEEPIVIESCNNNTEPQDSEITYPTPKISSISSSCVPNVVKNEAINACENAVGNEAPVRISTPPPVQPSLPVSPLKSPIRPRFVRPALLDTGGRRLSVHASSASESEDDCRKVTSIRTRKVSESALQVRNPIIAPPPSPKPPSLPIPKPTERNYNECARLAMLPQKRRPKISNFVRKLAEARRDFKKKYANVKPERSNLKMFDLIFYNPQSTPRSKKFPDKHEEAVARREIQLEEEEVDNPENRESDGASDSALPVPQVKIGANGEIILDEKSLFIETTEARKGREAFLNSVPVLDGKNKSYYGKKVSKHKAWTPIETKCFYKALNSIGTDFALMQSLFPTRTRSELKNKFKREEKLNGALVDDALGKPSAFNLKLLKEEMDLERALVEEETRKEKERQGRIEKERRENEAAKKAARAARIACLGPGGAALYQFVGHSVDVCEKPKGGPSRRPSSRRKLNEDFIDPFDVDILEEKISSGINYDSQTVENDSEITTICDDSKAFTKIPKDSGKRAAAAVGRKSIKKPRTSKDYTRYYPEILEPEEGNQCLEISDKEFFELMKENNKKTSIRIVIPKSSDEKQDVRIIFEESPESKNQSSEIKHDDPQADDHLEIYEDKKQEYIYNNVYETEQVIYEYPAQDMQVVESQAIHSENHQEIVEETVERDEIGDTEVCYSFPSPIYSATDSTPVDKNGRPFKTYVSLCAPNEDHIYTLQQSTSIADDMDTNSEIEPSSMDAEQQIRRSPTVKLFEPLETDDDLYSSQQDNTNADGFANSEGELETKMNPIDCRVTGGMQYSIIEEGACPEKKRTYLAGLKAGSFVFMANDTKKVPLERNCNMFMIKEQESSSGEKKLTPVPVLLPPELLKLITEELNFR